MIMIKNNKASEKIANDIITDLADIAEIIDEIQAEMDKNKADLYDKINQVEEEPDYEWLNDIRRNR